MFPSLQKPIDFEVGVAAFNATELNFFAISDAAKGYLGECAVSVAVPKSKGPAYAEYLENKGFTVYLGRQ
jgi:hypothetical protein